MAYEMTMKQKFFQTIFTLFVCVYAQAQTAGGGNNSSRAQQVPDYEKIPGAEVFDYTPGTKLGDAVFGTVVADMQHDSPGRNSHGGPVCTQYANGNIVAFCTDTSGHNIDGWTIYAVSKDLGRTWDMHHKFKYSYDAYQRNPKEPVWVEEGLVTKKGTAVLFITKFVEGHRSNSDVMRSHDNGGTWSDPQPVDGTFVGYPAAVAVVGETNYVLFDSEQAGYVLYESTDDGASWHKRGDLPFSKQLFYGALCVMKDGRLIAGAYNSKDETHLYYCISDDQGRNWSKVERAYVDQKIRDPELAYLGGKYYLEGRSGQNGPGRERFVLYQSDDCIHWGKGIIVSSDERGPDGYSHNCIVRTGNKDCPKELMIEYSIAYKPRVTNEYVFFIRPDASGM